MSPPPAMKRPTAYAPVPGHYDEMVDKADSTGKDGAG